MQIRVSNANRAVPLFKHFLLTRWDVTIEQRTAASGGTALAQPMTQTDDGFTGTVEDSTTWLRLTVRASGAVGSTTYELLHIRQDFNVPGVAGTTLQPLGWKKGAPSDPIGLYKGIPNLHPLLVLSGTNVALDIHFVDVTDLYLDMHGRSPWFLALNLLRGTDRTIRIMASLGGHPLIWYVTVPAICAGIPKVKPAVFVMPADYGAISYENSLRGIQTSTHGKSAGSLQSGLETFCWTLTEPLTDERYMALLARYVALRKTFSGPADDLPQPLHHFRGVLTYQPSSGKLVPQYWDVPMGAERAIHDEKYILMMPVMNGGEGGFLIQPGLHRRIDNAINYLYSHGTTLHYESIDIAKPVLGAYSQSGGNVFTSADRNRDDIGGLVLFEPQYMNDYLGSEDRNLTLGKVIIPELLRRNVKVVVVGRYRERPRKYLPDGKGDGILALPDAANYHLLAYPLPSSGGYAGAHPVVRYRYSRLVDGRHDTALDQILSSEDPATVDPATANSEAKVDETIAAYRRAGLSDDAVIRRVFSAEYEPDAPGAYYPHNLILVGGQTFDSTSKRYRGFFHEALIAIG